MFCDFADSFHWRIRSLGLGGSGGGFAGSHGNSLIMLIQLAVFHDVFINITCFDILVLCDLAESFDAKDAGVRGSGDYFAGGHGNESMMLIPLALFHDVLDLDLTYSDIRVLRDLIRVLDIGILNGAGPDRKMRIWPRSVNADLALVGKCRSGPDRQIRFSCGPIPKQTKLNIMIIHMFPWPW